jgi:predicted TIM-barrel fold metal-dependent hydrolase
LFPDDWIRPFLERSLAELPELELFDVHTHIGENDPDGFSCQPEELLTGLERMPGQAAVFAMHEPGGYRAANERVILEAEGSGGRLVAFCRLDPHSEPLAEVERCLEAGAVGIKLHPRAEAFELATPDLRDVFALADERRLPVLVHAGRGIPALGRHAVELCGAFPGIRLILAHAGICDLAWIWEAARERQNLFFDTAWWSAADLLALLTLVPPGQVLFGSDTPYGTPTYGATQTLRYALQAGLSGEQIRSVAGEQAARLVAGEDPLDLGPAVGPAALAADPLLDRIYTFLVSAIGQMFNGVAADETLALAALACDMSHDSPHLELCRNVIALLELRDQVAAQQAAPAEPDESAPRAQRIAPGVPLVIAAAMLVRTPSVPLPAAAPASVSTPPFPVTR